MIHYLRFWFSINAATAVKTFELNGFKSNLIAVKILPKKVISTKLILVSIQITKQSMG